MCVFYFKNVDMLLMLPQFEVQNDFDADEFEADWEESMDTFSGVDPSGGPSSSNGHLQSDFNETYDNWNSPATPAIRDVSGILAGRKVRLSPPSLPR